MNISVLKNIFGNQNKDKNFEDKYKVAAFIVNYNMPERADKLAHYIKKTINWPVDVYLVDNGSDISKPAKNTNVLLKKNVQTCNGWLEGLKAADKSGRKYFAYWFLITSARFIGGDPLKSMIEVLIDDKNAVGVHPSLTPESTTAWNHLINRKTMKIRRTWMIDNIASLYRASWFNEIGRFDRKMIYAWGIDLETCYLARKQNKSIWIDDKVMVEKVTDIGYKMNRMNMTSNERSTRAEQNMREILEEKYGANYWDLMINDYVKEEWR
ncbi:MAG: hypothetical protein PHS54_06735 [Clostridia bacterium]|nr:hypothetical protein [Clostridia bacterium]